MERRTAFGDANLGIAAVEQIRNQAQEFLIIGGADLFEAEGFIDGIQLAHNRGGSSL